MHITEMIHYPASHISSRGWSASGRMLYHCANTGWDVRSWVMNHLSNVHPRRIHPQFVYRLPFLSWLKRLLEMKWPRSIRDKKTSNVSAMQAMLLWTLQKNLKETSHQCLNNYKLNYQSVKSSQQGQYLKQECLSFLTSLCLLFILLQSCQAQLNSKSSLLFLQDYLKFKSTWNLEILFTCIWPNNN